MRENDIRGKIFRRYNKHRYQHHIAKNSTNLLRKRELVTSTNQVWVGDITFIRVGDEWNYLSVVMDLYSRKIIGWLFAKYRSAKLVTEVVYKALKENTTTSETIFIQTKVVNITHIFIMMH